MTYMQVLSMAYKLINIQMEELEHISKYIADSIKTDGLEIHYQPQFCLIGGCFEVTGVEALLRPDTSICHIETLIAVAIETHQIVELGYWIIKKVATQLRQWVDQKLVTSTFTAAINVSGEQLADAQFCQTVYQIITDAEIDPSQITIELTESSIIDDANIAKIYHLSAVGFTISIDDFGTGYSSFGRLKLLPVQEIKIDKMFVDDITKTTQDVALITALFQLTVALSKFTIVEGVENESQYNMLREIGFTCFQGYFFSMAESASDIAETISLINSLHYRPCLQ